jgi:hypothetical protein
MARKSFSRLGRFDAGHIKVTTTILAVLLLVIPALADNPRVLLGTWEGKATGPGGGPPTGEIAITFSRGKDGQVEGTIAVRGPGGSEYTGRMEKITLVERTLNALAVFKLGETPIEVQITGPLKGSAIQGTFTASTKGQELGQGTFSITKKK